MSKNKGKESSHKGKDSGHKEEKEREFRADSDSGSQGDQTQPNGEDGASQSQGDDEKLAELNDRYLRLVAEFDNYRRRTAKERMDLVVNAAEETIKGLLPVLDDFERAIQVLSNIDGDIKAAVEGTELIYNKLMTYLISKGLKRIEAAGEELDTDFHEAVAQFPVEDESKKNRIIDVVQQGYTMNGKVIRFAKVVVGV